MKGKAGLGVRLEDLVAGLHGSRVDGAVVGRILERAIDQIGSARVPAGEPLDIGFRVRAQQTRQQRQLPVLAIL